jgi:PTS system nitrogen regulatory IIA component
VKLGWIAISILRIALLSGGQADMHEWLSVEELAQFLGRDRREIEKLVQRGRIPGRRTQGEWLFHPIEVTHWLEHEMREFSGDELHGLERAHQKSEADIHCPVRSLLDLETVQVPLEGRTKRSVLECLIEVAGRTWQIWSPADILEAVQQREEVMPTGFESGVAIPHPRNPLPDAYGQSLIAFGRTMSGIPFGAPKRQLTDLFFLVLCRDSRTHLHVLSRLGRMIQLPGFVDELRSAADSRQAYDTICSADERLRLA